MIRDLALLKAIFNRAIKAGKMKSDPVKAVPLFKENNARPRCLTDEEEARFYEALPDYLKPFLTVALHARMRWGELARLTWAAVDFYTGTLHVRESKSGEGRRIPMNRIVGETLQAVRREQIQKAREQAGGEREILSLLVFCAPQGGFLRNFGRDWYPPLAYGTSGSSISGGMTRATRRLPAWSWPEWTSTPSRRSWDTRRWR